MAEIASLSLEVKSDQVKTASVALREMAPAASAAERAAQKWGVSTTAAARSTEDFSRRVQGTIRNLEFERAQLTRSAAEKAKYIALRRAGVAAASAEGQAIAASTAALLAEQKAMERRALVMNKVRSAAFALGAAFGAAIAIRKFFAATIEADAAQAQLAATLESTGGIAGQTIETLNEHAAALQRVTTYGDEAVNGAQALLLTFTQIRGDVFPKATEAVLNVATAMKTDLKSAAIQVGKALNDPILGVTALARSGIQFTESQKAMIKSLVDSGQMVAAQTLILKELDAQFGGSAKAARETLGGALKALSNAFGDLFEINSKGSEPLRLAIEDLVKAISNPAFAKFVQTVGVLLFGAISLSAKGFGMMAAGIGTLVDGFVWLDDQVYKTANIIIGAFVTAYEDVSFIWKNFPDIMSAAFVGAVNAAIRGINAMVQFAATGIDKLIDLVNKIPGVNVGKLGNVSAIGEMDNPAAGRVAPKIGERGAAQAASMSRDYLGRDASALQDALGNFHTGTGRAKATPPPDGSPGDKGKADPYKAAIESAKEYILTKKAETAAVGETGVAAARMKHEQALLNKVQSEGKLATEAQKTALGNLAQQMAEADIAFKSSTFMNDNKTKAEEFVANQEMEQQALFMSTQAADALRFSTEALNAAKRAGIELTPAQIDSINQAAQAMASAKSKTAEFNQIISLGRDVFKGFFSDMREGLMNGQTVWESFGNAAVNALNRIAEKLIEMAATQLFDAAFGGSGGGGGGFLSSILGGLFGGGGGTSAVAGANINPFSGFMMAANGAAFNRGNVIPFAGGGIVTGPTMFPMAGGRSGVMGEAGPEGIMPLRRGRDGRLGVEASGGGQQRPVIVYVTGDTDLVRVEAEGAATRVVAQSSPRIVGEAVKQSGKQVVGIVEQNHLQRGGEYR